MRDIDTWLTRQIRHSAMPLLLVVGLAMVPAVQPVFADSDSTPTCRKGKVWDQKKQMCVPAKYEEMDDNGLADTAFWLNQEERYSEALQVLALAKNQNDPNILNYRGYATRKLGRVDEGIRFYNQALAIDPDNVLVRSYLGEAYLKKGKPDKAIALLAEIRARCGTDCKAYQSLADAIEAAG